jgi:phosphopantothenate---cysteine ligase (CTP)
VNVLVTGGGTSAPIDDVRTITNISTGRFAAAISESCLTRGASVWHVHTPSAALPVFRQAQLDLETADVTGELDRLRRLYERWKRIRGRLHLVALPEGTVAHYARTLEHLLRTQPIDIAFLAMAVSDYEPDRALGKLSSDEDKLLIRCRRTSKVIRNVRDWSPEVYLVGFKLLSRSRTDELLRQAEASGRVNRADLTVANDLQSLKAGVHTVHLVRTGQPPLLLPPGPDLADRLVEQVFAWAGCTSRSGTE